MIENLIKINKITFSISIILFIISSVILLQKKINFGIEFTGGIEIELSSNNIIDIDYIKEKLNKIKNIKIKYYGSNKNIQIKMKEKDNKDIIPVIKNEIEKKNEENYIEITKIEYIGSEINNETIKNSIIAIILAIILMSIYITIRFEYKAAISSVLALIHDIILILGILSLFQIEFNLSTLASILAVLGYSINDTVIIFDRIRENKNKYKNNILFDIINISIKNTLTRTIITSLSTLFVTITLIIFGGEALFAFALVLILGIVIGTYSSIYIATKIYYILNYKKI